MSRHRLTSLWGQVGRDEFPIGVGRISSMSFFRLVEVGRSSYQVGPPTAIDNQLGVGSRHALVMLVKVGRAWWPSGCEFALLVEQGLIQYSGCSSSIEARS